MNVATLEAIAGALGEAQVRYLIAGGVAVVAHGYPRLTVDLDLVVALRGDNLLAAFRALGRLGFRPTVPITAEQFADDAQRERFRTEKGMLDLNLYSNQYRDTTVDIFVAEPFDFDAEYTRASLQEIGPGLPVRFVTIPTLIDMKIKAGRPRDLDDVEHLRMILDERTRESRS